MKINLSKQTYYLGEAILVDINYQNLFSSAVSMPDPKASFDVEMHLLDVNSQEDLSYTMGQSETTVMEDDSDQWALSVPVPENISIPANGIYHFISDPNERLYLRPGKFVLFVTDPNSESERVEVTVLLNKSALKHLSSIAMAPEQGYSRREWAMTNVQSVYPKFILKLPDDSCSKTTASEYEKNNQLQYQELIQWLNSNLGDIPIS